MKQTAVQWLADQYEQKIGKGITMVMLDEINQALQMEKEQMIEFAWQYSVDEITKEGLILEFNEKYGGKP